MIDIRKLKELVKLMVENDLAELDLRDQEETVTIRRGGAGPVVASPVLSGSMPVQASGGPAESLAETKPGGGDDGLVPIESPMVGTFYSSPNPDSEPFVSAGAEISEGSVVCIVEAMKVFNEIKSDVSGTIERVCVKSGEPVEFGQPLYMVRPT